MGRDGAGQGGAASAKAWVGMGGAGGVCGRRGCCGERSIDCGAAGGAGDLTLGMGGAVCGGAPARRRDGLVEDPIAIRAIALHNAKHLPPPPPPSCVSSIAGHCHGGGVRDCARQDPELRGFFPGLGIGNQLFQCVRSFGAGPDRGDGGWRASCARLALRSNQVSQESGALFLLPNKHTLAKTPFSLSRRLPLLAFPSHPAQARRPRAPRPLPPPRLDPVRVRRGGTQTSRPDLSARFRRLDATGSLRSRPWRRPSPLPPSPFPSRSSQLVLGFDLLWHHRHRVLRHQERHLLQQPVHQGVARGRAGRAERGARSAGKNRTSRARGTRRVTAESGSVGVERA